MYNIEKADFFDIKGTQHGLGRFVCADYIFEGQFQNNLPNGFGRKLLQTGGYEIGFFKNNIYLGRATQSPMDRPEKYENGQLLKQFENWKNMFL